MARTPSHLQWLAELAGLHLDPREERELGRDLDALLGLVAELADGAFSATPKTPTTPADDPPAPLDAAPAPLRDDTDHRAAPRDALLGSAPEARGGLVVVPGQSGRLAARTQDEEDQP